MDAETIASKLMKERTELVNRELANLIAISDMTATQEVNEEAINGLQRQRNTIQKEYEGAQIRINRMEKASNKSDKEIDKDETERLNRIKKQGEDERKERERLGVAEMDRLAKEHKDKQDLEDKAHKEQLDKDKAQKKAIEDLEKEHAESKFRIAESVTNLINGIAGKNKALLKASLIADKALAIAEIVIQTRKANAATRAWGAIGGPVGMVLAEAAILKNNIAAGFNIAAVIAAAAVGLAGMARGGKITQGVHVNTGKKDDTLILANKTETVLTDKHVAMLGGSGMMRRIGVPGYAMGGYIGQQAPEIPAAGFDYAAIARLMNSIEVKLDINKVNSAQKEVSIIEETQRI